MRLKKCKRCGTTFKAPSYDIYMCPSCAAEIRSNSVMRTRTCQTCGTSFLGGPRAWYCPACRAERKKSQRKAYDNARKNKTIRPLGSIDICQNCGKEYVVKSGGQIYCPDCADNVVRKKVNAHKRKYMQENKEKFAPHKAEMRSNGWICAVCGKVFDKDSPTVTCSEECAKKLKKINQDKADIKRGKRKMSAGVSYESGLPKSGVTGITYHRKSGKWQVTYKCKYIGLFRDLDSAKEALRRETQDGKGSSVQI
jgi:uncharacterized Zn ribbon protein/predicted nucleic acid-binding Zn ribbon protein